MDDINTVYALLVLIMFFVLLSRLDNRFGKIERELNEIKKRMDDYLKVQQRGVTEKVKLEGEALKKENEDISASPQIIEKTSTLETKQQKETVPEKQKPFVETVIREALEGTREKTVETELEDVCVEAVPKQKKQVNYEKFIGENLFGKIGILMFVIGVGFFVKYAIDKNWINETFRTVLGFLTGAVLLVVAERLQKKYRTFSSLLAGGAFAVFYLTVAIAFHYYHLLADYGVYHSDRRHCIYVCFVCGIQSARTGHHFTCRRISCTFHRKQWRGKLSGTVHLCKYPESRYVRTFHL